ncbi:DegT/DnrJ/EryC1/StrS family aminotransferase [Brevibacterium linens]|uniref:DegT/DnrJ/EryC1/StrS family aminotransferase n=1 Tax=Brevibacterium linens TaxID=1703 RepID=UPI00351232A4
MTVSETDRSTGVLPPTAARPHSPSPVEADRIPLSTPDVGSLEETYLLAAFRSGWIAPVGPDLSAFESELAAATGVAHAVALSSGTAALHLGLLGLGVRTGDRVLTSTMTFAATANAITYCGATPEFVDCGPDGNIDPGLLHHRLKLSARAGRLPAAIVPVDLLGRPADYERILPVAAEYEVPVLVDAAESLGSEYLGQPVGGFGRASAVSFNGNKIMTTSGGGALLTDDPELARRAAHLAAQARQPVVHYEHQEIGYNYRLSNLLAALGRAQLTRLEQMVERRRAHRRRYADFFADHPGLALFGDGNHNRDNAWLTAVIVDEAETGISAGALGRMLADRGIETRPLWKPMHLQPVFARCSMTGGRLSEFLFSHGLTLPSGSAMRDDQLDRVLSALDELLTNGRR